ncbi:hypothetical protein [Pseudomonas entomophila]|uniref:hypothetical protein n=1 Tax=Pseudomonas entomophila TaxID=312306 RepID=UPI00200E3D24|nr:hypothetical protein [Pseudomonas entomophila]
MNKEHWMGAYPELGRLRIDQLILPGTHDSGMDKQANGLSLPNEITQDVPCIEQIRGGIRVLDLRVRAYPQHAQTSALHFQLFHLNSSGRTIKEDIVDALNGFYENPDNAKEIVILDFHEFSRFDPDEHRLLQALLAELGPRMIPYSLHGLTLDELWREHPGRTVVIGYDQGRTPPEYWPSVSHRWIGKNTPSTSTLKVYMDQVAGYGESGLPLTSIQCAKYVWPFFVPDDFHDKIDEWFESRDLNSYIQHFRIINTDWSLRGRIVDNCIHANRLRASAMG